MPRVVDKEAKRAGILQAAIRAFAEKGVANTKIADIAEYAGIGKGTLYEYYSNKEEIFEEAMMGVLAAIETGVMEQMSHVSDPRAKLRGIVWGMIDGASSLKEYISIMLDFWAVGLRKENYGRWREAYQSFIAMIKDILEEGIRKKVFRQVDAQSLASALTGLFDGFVFQLVLFGPDYPIRKTIDALLDGILHGIELERNTE